MQKPDSNLHPDAQPWGRYQEERDAGHDVRLDNLEGQFQRLAMGDGAQATVFAEIRASIDKLLYEMETLYFLTGNTYPPVPAGTAPPEAPTYDVEEVAADWSRTWGTSSYYTGSSEHVNGSYLYQGSNPENKIGMWHFPLSASRGKIITDVQMFMQNINAAWASSFTAGFGTHGNVSAPVGKPGRVNGFDVGWGRGEGKWIAVPSWAWDGLSNGSIQGFTVGGIGPSDPNYAYFQGVGMGSPPRLKVTYQA